MRRGRRCRRSTGSARPPSSGKPQYTEIVDHIDHMVNVAGIDHVGLGSDFDGSRTPTGMEDCSRVPRITEEMMNRGYSEEDIRKVLGLNVLRVPGGVGRRVGRQGRCRTGTRASRPQRLEPHGIRGTVKLNVDKKADALYLRLDESRIVESEEVSPGIVLDCNESNGGGGRGDAPPLGTLTRPEPLRPAVRDGLTADELERIIN